MMSDYRERSRALLVIPISPETSEYGAQLLIAMQEVLSADPASCTDSTSNPLWANAKEILDQHDIIGFDVRANNEAYGNEKGLLVFDSGNMNADLLARFTQHLLRKDDAEAIVEIYLESEAILISAYQMESMNIHVWAEETSRRMAQSFEKAKLETRLSEKLSESAESDQESGLSL
jgi:hypothetical protein